MAEKREKGKSGAVLTKSSSVENQDFGPSVQTYKRKNKKGAGNVGSSNVNHS